MDPLQCGAPGCQYETPAAFTEAAQILQLMTLHTTQAHGLSPAAAHPPTKIEKRPRPVVKQEMTEHDWRYFRDEWNDYKRVTGVAGQNLLNELWCCMFPDLRRLALDQGGKEALTTKDLMLAQIRLLAVHVLHEAAHTVALHEAKQMADETTKTFAARVRGIASNCSLSKMCSCNPATKVSFVDETVYHVVLAGLRDREMQERALSAAILKTIKGIQSLVEFCSAEESGRMTTPTIGGVRSSYQKSKFEEQQTRRDPQGKCSFCGEKPHTDSGP